MDGAGVLVTGASGHLGGLVISHLRTRLPEDRIFGLVRRDKDAEVLRSQGIGARMADYNDPEGLVEAMHGIERVLLVSGSAIGQRVGQHRNVIQAARAANVPYIVYTSILDAQNSPMMLAEEHKTTEDMIRTSGLAYTILRNGWYSENLLASLQADLKIGKHFGAAGQGRISAAPRKDYAEAAAVVLSTRGHVGRTYELAGDNAVTLGEYTAMLSEVSGTPVDYVDAPEEEFRAALTKIGMPAAFAAILANSDANAAEGALYSDSKDLSMLIGHATEPMRDTIANALA